MPASINVDGLDALESMLDKAGQDAGHIAAAGLYDGAGVMADRLTAAIDGIRTQPFHYAKDGQKRLPSPEEKAVLQRARHGVAKFRDSGTSVQTSVGLQNSGYTKMVGKTSVPIPKIANAINSGTSFMQKQPFFRKAVSQGQAQATAAIEQKIKEKAESIG